MLASTFLHLLLESPMKPLTSYPSSYLVRRTIQTGVPISKAAGILIIFFVRGIFLTGTFLFIGGLFESVAGVSGITDCCWLGLKLLIGAFSIASEASSAIEQ